jgi:hypothetical protein
MDVTFKPLKSCLSSSNLLDLTAEDDHDGSTFSSRSPTTRDNSIKRNVSFGHIKIREHPRALGDNPSVSSGPALSLGWYSEDPDKCEHSRTVELPLDEYEDGRPSRRVRHELVVPRHEREKVLRLEAGVSLSEMYAAQREAVKVKQSRRGSVLPGPPAVRLLENIAKLLKKQGKRNHKAEQKQLDELMERAAAAEKIRKQHEQAYREELMMQRRRQQQEKESVVKLSALPHSASEPFFRSHIPDMISVSSAASEDDDGDNEALDF